MASGGFHGGSSHSGGFHSSGLRKLIRSGNVKAPKLHSIPHDQRGAYPAAYSYEAADALHGYASGMEYPFFYDSEEGMDAFSKA